MNLAALTTESRRRPPRQNHHTKQHGPPVAAQRARGGCSLSFGVVCAVLLVGLRTTWDLTARGYRSRTTRILSAPKWGCRGGLIVNCIAWSDT